MVSKNTCDKAMNSARELGRYVLDLLFPGSGRCVLCGMTNEASVCYNCVQHFSPVRPPQGIPHVDNVMALATYTRQIRSALHRLKYFQKPALAHNLALLATETWAVEIKKYDVVTSVPMHRSRYIQRGYNQAELLARELASALAMPYRVCLSRVSPTVPQHSLSRSRRKQNVREAFAPALPFKCTQSVLLVDDVLTTGSTVASCAKVLKESGIRHVGVLVIAYADL